MDVIKRHRTLAAVACLMTVSCFGRAAAAAEANVEDFNTAYLAYKQHVEMSEFESAESFAKDAYEIGRLLFGEDGARTAMLSFNYGVMLRLNDRADLAKEILLTTLERNEALHGSKSEKLIPVHMELGKATLHTSDKRSVSKRHFDKALRLARGHYGKDSAKVGEMLLLTGREILNASGSRDAEKYLRDARDILRKALGPASEPAGRASYNLARIPFLEKNYSKAKPYLLEALASFDTPESPGSAMEVKTHAWLVEVFEETGEPDRASEHCVILGRAEPVSDPRDLKPIYFKAPRYPASALSARAEGFVEFAFTVDENGAVRDPRILRTVGPDSFEAAALSALERFRYPPRIVDGVPVATEGMTTKISFKIED